MVKFHVFLILTSDGSGQLYTSAVWSLGRAFQYALNTMLNGIQIQSEHDNKKNFLAGKPTHVLQSIASLT
jgi:hypothetical protein